MSNQENIEGVRHSLAHLLAQTVKEMWPGSLNAIGPVIEDGFYTDFEMKGKLSEDDLPKIEEAMRAKLKEWTHFDKKEVTVDEAKEIFADNKYKLELIDEFAKESKILTVYTCGGFDDLCKGGHSDGLANIDPKSFKLTRTAGAYWRGDEKNIMLTRIYAVAFTTETELEEYLDRQELAKERDHRKLGKEMELFSFSDLVGPGLPLFTPRGTILRRLLKDLMRQAGIKNGSQEVEIPHIAKKDLYVTSGHAQKFTDELFEVESRDENGFNMKPVNCPHHIQIFMSKPRSYKELPVHYSEVTMQYRDEKPGQLMGLQRVRSITVDDGHIFLAKEQIMKVVADFVKIIEEVHTGVGIYGEHWVSLSLSDPKTPDAYIGTKEDWALAESMLKEASEANNLNAKPMEGEAALYGPKLDFVYYTVGGVETQLATIQLDFATPKRFGMKFINNRGEEETPVMVHRAILGSLERFMVILLERTNGWVPFWLAPEQVRVLTINDSVADYVEGITTILKDTLLMEPLKYNELRYSVDDRNESLGKKIKEATELKIPVQLIVGPKDKEAGQVSVRTKDGESKIKLEELKDFLLNLK
ncbi:MAG: threonyl-tRNA synthetase [Patescibacteria group bacterium]|nr:threonyl-tRNA synthetase [Patescibacteria group bacterium]